MDVAQLGFQIDSRQAVAASRKLDQMGAAAGRAQTATQRMAGQVNAELSRLNGTLRSFAGGFAAAFSVVALTQFARGLARVADEYANVQGRLRLVTQSQEQLGRVTADVFAISQRTYASIDATSTLVARTTRALVSNGAAQDVALQKSLLLSEAVNNAFLVSGAATQEATNAIIQLSQGLAAGALRGEEFNSIAEQGPRIMQALAQYLGVTTGELRAMAQEGKLTAEIVQNALLASFTQLTEEAAQMPVTIGRALQQLDNSFAMLVGQLDQASQGSAGVAGAIQTIARAIDMVTPSLMFLAQAWATNKGATDDSANATRQLAEAMRILVGGLVIAKNIVDVLVDGFRVMVRVGLEAAFVLIESFDDLATTFTALLQSLNNPAALLASAGTIEAAMTRVGERAKSILQEGEAAGRDFHTSFAENMADVSLVFEMLNQELQGFPASTTPAVAAVAAVGVQAGASAQEVEKLARAQKAMLDLIGGMRGDESPELRVEEDQAQRLRNIEEAKRKLIVAGEDLATATRMEGEAIRLSNAMRGRELRVVQQQAAQRQRAQQAVGRLVGGMQTELSLLRMSAGERRAAVAAMDAEYAMRQAIAEAQEAGIQYTEEEVDSLMKLAREMAAAAEEAEWMQGILDDFNNTGMNGLISEIERVGEALQKALTPDQREAMLAYMEKLQAAASEYRQQGLETMVGATQQVLSSIQGLSKDGSKAYKAMEVASQALNVVLAIGAILNQGKGDPYTAFARMAAMAVAVAGLVGSIGANFGGSSGMTDTAAERQATQGTGTVLGDAEAKSQSILNAMEITADATSELVGINRGMLNALTALQGGLDRAGGMLARGANNAPFTEIGGSFRFADNFLGGALSSLPLDPLNILGGSSQITDQGIRLGGGGLGDLDIMGFQEQQYRRWRFGSRRTREELVGVSEELESQFQLVVNSIVETVRQGALALGLLPADIEAALEAFRLEEIRISLKDLSADEQQAELLAVFSSIFDNLAGEVVPFIEQFQRVGEGLGETLVRVATSVQVTQEAMTRLGFSLGELDPETFAQISVSLIDMVGGIEEFAGAMRSFVGNFAPEAHQLAIAQNDLTRAFAEVGLTVPATREGMWELMQSLDATTEAGRAQIATLLRLSGVADSYYMLLERSADTELQNRINHLDALLDANRAYYDFAEDIARQFAESIGSDLSTSLIDVERTYRRNVQTANELARAAGMAGAAERDLARIELIAARQRVEAIRLTEESARDLAGQLGLTELSQIESQIGALESASIGIQSAVGGVSDAFDAAAQRAKETIELLIGDLSPLRDAEKLQIALQGLQAGTVSADQVLQIGRRLYGSGNDYRQLFDQVLALRPLATGDGGTIGGGGGPAPISPELQALLDRRDEINAAQAAQQARTNALTLVEQIAELAQVQALSFEDVAGTLGVNLADLANILQVDSETLTEMLNRQAQEAVEVQDAVLEMPELFAEAVEPITEELEALRAQVSELIEQIGQVVQNTARTADATESTTQQTANRDLVDTTVAPRSSRIGAAGGSDRAMPTNPTVFPDRF
jgi:tape measure domain-containing protein